MEWAQGRHLTASIHFSFYFVAVSNYIDNNNNYNIILHFHCSQPFFSKFYFTICCKSYANGNLSIELNLSPTNELSSVA